MHPWVLSARDISSLNCHPPFTKDLKNAKRRWTYPLYCTHPYFPRDCISEKGIDKLPLDGTNWSFTNVIAVTIEARLLTVCRTSMCNDLFQVFFVHIDKRIHI